MIYIHCENLGLKSHLVNTMPLEETSAKNYNWRIRLSSHPISSDKDVTVVTMPVPMAIALANWFFLKDASAEVLPHLEHILMQATNPGLDRLDFSVICLTNARNEKRSISDLACMAIECEDHIEYAHKNMLFALLDAKGFEKFCEVEG